MFDHTRDLCTIEDAAEYLGVTPTTVRRRIAAGDLAAYRIRGGAGVRLRVSDVESLLEPLPSCAAATNG